jgi:hypothetical protein
VPGSPSAEWGLGSPRWGAPRTSHWAARPIWARTGPSLQCEPGRTHLLDAAYAAGVRYVDVHAGRAMLAVRAPALRNSRERQSGAGRPAAVSKLRAVGRGERADIVGEARNENAPLAHAAEFTLLRMSIARACALRSLVMSRIAAQMIIMAKPAPNSVVMYFAAPTGAVKASRRA